MGTMPSRPARSQLSGERQTGTAPAASIQGRCTLACPNAHAVPSQRPVQLLAGCHPAMSIQWPSSSLMAMRKARCPSASPSCAKLNPVGLSTTTFPTRIIVGRHSAWSATPALRNRCHSQTLGSEFAKNSSRTLWCIKEASRMPTSQSEELAVDARQRRADTSSPQEPAHDRIGEEGLIATPFEQWKIEREHRPAFGATGALRWE